MELREYSLIIANIAYADGTGSKVRPAFVIELDDEKVMTYRITSQNTSKVSILKLLIM